ncbi:MAG TPA: cell wall hydrolase [Clostridiaceae bacterium]|nr:cell wall hydrolase [Clostridiaceae bacterium]
MIILVRKSNLILIGLVFLLLITIYSLNAGAGEKLSVSDEVPAANEVTTAQKVVMLDPGHGGEDPGAVSDYSGIKEKDINLSIAFKTKELLEKEGFKVLMTREEDKLEYQPGTTNIIQKRKQDLLRRKKMMDEGGADIVVSIHMNKFGKTQYHGAQTFYPPKSVEGQRLAISIQKSLREIVDPTNTRGALEKKEPIIILKDYKTPTVIVECGFLSNPEEEKKLQTEEYLNKIALAIKEGIKNYFNSASSAQSESQTE